MFFSLVFGAELEEAYERPDFVGRVIWQLLVPPTSYQEVIKKYGTHKNIQVRLGPRPCVFTEACKPTGCRLHVRHIYFYVLFFWIGPFSFLIYLERIWLNNINCVVHLLQEFLQDVDHD